MISVLARRFAGDIKDQMPDQELVWPNQYINPQIRAPLRDRIRRFTSNWGQNLNHQIWSWPILMAYAMMAKSSQANIDDFDSGPDDDDTDEVIGKLALIYARVSSHEQSTAQGQDDDHHNPEGSIEGQIEELKDIANNNELELAHDPIVDKAKTGTNFDREGIQKVFQIAQREEIGYLLVEKIDRIGRSAAETLYFIYILQSECDVTLITPSGEKDLGQIEGLLHTTLMSLMAEIENEIRTSKATKERVRGFVENHNWSAYTHVVPIGYTKTDDGWLEIDQDEEDAIKDLFNEFTDPSSEAYANYAATRRKINKRYDGILDGHRVKTLLQYHVYVGKPQIPEDWVIDLPYENVVEDQDLQIIDDETFEEAQRIIEEKDDRHSTDEDTRTVTDFVQEFDLFSVLASSDPVALLHDCGEPMVKNGQRDLDGELTTHLYYCQECDEYRKWPQGYEHTRMKVIHLLLDDDTSFLEALKAAISMVN